MGMLQAKDRLYAPFSAESDTTFTQQAVLIGYVTLSIGAAIQPL